MRRTQHPRPDGRQAGRQHRRQERQDRWGGRSIPDQMGDKLRDKTGDKRKTRPGRRTQHPDQLGDKLGDKTGDKRKASPERRTQRPRPDGRQAGRQDRRQDQGGGHSIPDQLGDKLGDKTGDKRKIRPGRRTQHTSVLVAPFKALCHYTLWDHRYPSPGHLPKCSDLRGMASAPACLLRFWLLLSCTFRDCGKAREADQTGLLRQRVSLAAPGAEFCEARSKHMRLSCRWTCGWSSGQYCLLRQILDHVFVK